MTTNENPQKSASALFGAAVIAPLAVRGVLLIEGGIGVEWADGTGLLSDLAASILVAVALALLARGTRIGPWFAAGLAGLWSLLNFANYEHIRELGSIVNLSYAGYAADPTFFFGSALKPTHPLLLLAITSGSVVLAWHGSVSRGKLTVKPAAGAAIVLAVLVTIIPDSTGIAEWRQTDLVAAQFGRLLGRTVGRAVSTPGDETSLAALDLSGTPIIDFGKPARNVILILLEGVSGAYLPSLREFHGRSSNVSMPGLDRVARQGWSWATFLTTQRQTNRGEYAILCGEYPKLLSSEARMTELAGGDPLPCLPAALAREGFTTHYMQAAPMPFMMKDRFMPRAGFGETLGNAHFKLAHNRNHWGVDDRTFFEESLRKVDELRRGVDPWFLTLLTVGTHHRYNVPPDFRGEHEPGSQAWAFEYLDMAVAGFISELEARGVLEDTLVLITSDESQAMEPGAPDAANMLTQAWGFLIALLPDRATGLVGEVFTQPDIPVSIFDYLSSGSDNGGFAGRSVFRSYESGRDVYWGNTHLGMVAGLSVGGVLTLCTEDFSSCLSAEAPGATLLSPTLQPRAANPADVERLREAALRSLSDLETDRARRFELVSRGPHPVVETSSEQYVFGGQFVSMPAHSRAKVEIVMELQGEAGWIDFTNNFTVDLRPHFSRSGRLEAGRKLHLRYSVDTDYDLTNLECRLWITAHEGEDLSLVFEAAEMQIVPLPPAEPAGGTVEHVFSITAVD